MNPILSIVIPTKNRYEYLTVLINAILKFESNKFEIIVQDNSQNNAEFLPFINSIKDSRLRYNYYGEWLSVCDNCDMGVSLSKGSYVCMLGDDDGIMEWAVGFAEWMLHNNLDAAVINKINYNWPDITSKMWNEAMSGNINWPDYKFTVSNINTQSELNKVLSKGGTTLANLPRVYHGIVSKNKLDELKAVAGSYFPGPSPDMANAIGLGVFCENVCYADYPLVISGHSIKSTGGQGAKGEHHGKIEEQDFLPANTKLNWTKRVPFFWSGSTILAESVLKSLSATKSVKLMNKFNFNYLYASCFLFEPKYGKDIQKVIKENYKGLSILPVIIGIAFAYLTLFLFRLKIFTRNFLRLKLKIKNKNLSYDGCPTVGSVIEIIKQRFIKDQNNWGWIKL